MVPLVETLIAKTPPQLRRHLYKHRELVKFLLVGGTCFVIDTAIFATLFNTILMGKDTTSKVIASLIATIVSYVLNREWSFKNRGGREGPHEAALFFLVSILGIGVTALPLFIATNIFHMDAEHLSKAALNISNLWWGSIVGTALAMVFRWWAFRKFVFPNDYTHVDINDPAHPRHRARNMKLP